MVGYFIIHDNIIVGSCGFVGKPNDGVVEIAYWTFKEYEGKGVAGLPVVDSLQLQKSRPHLILLPVRLLFQCISKNTSETWILFYSNAQDIEIGAAWDWRLTVDDI